MRHVLASMDFWVNDHLLELDHGGAYPDELYEELYATSPSIVEYDTAEFHEEIAEAVGNWAASRDDALEMADAVMGLLVVKGVVPPPDGYIVRDDKVVPEPRLSQPEAYTVKPGEVDDPFSDEWTW